MISNPFFELGEKDPAQLLVEINSIISAYDTEHDGDTQFTKAADHCKNLRAYLWALAHGDIDPIKCACDPDDEDLDRPLRADDALFLNAEGEVRNADGELVSRG